MDNDIRKYREILTEVLNESPDSYDEIIPKSEVHFNIPDDEELTISDDDDEKLFEVLEPIRRFSSMFNNREKKLFKQAVNELIKRFHTRERRIAQKNKKSGNIKTKVYDKEYFDELIKALEIPEDVKKQLKDKHYNKITRLIKLFGELKSGKKDVDQVYDVLEKEKLKPQKIVNQFIEDSAYYIVYKVYTDNNSVNSILDKDREDRGDKDKNKKPSYVGDFTKNLVTGYMSKASGKK